jgi:hypothetical protein
MTKNMNATKTIVIGHAGCLPVKQSISFKHYLEHNVDEPESLKLVSTKGTLGLDPSEFKYIELICSGYTEGCDLMFAYVNPNKRDHGVLFIGKWNDGVVK